MLMKSDEPCRPLFTRVNNNGKIDITFSEKIILSDYENLSEEIVESGAIQLQLMCQVDYKVHNATDFSWSISQKNNRTI